MVKNTYEVDGLIFHSAKELSKHYKVSTDYILGLTDNPKQNI